MTTPTLTSGLSPGDLVLTHSTYLPLRVGTPLLVLEVEPGAVRIGRLGSPRLRVITPVGAPSPWSSTGSSSPPDWPGPRRRGTSR